MHVVGKHEEDVLVILARDHGEKAIDLPGENGHALVFGGRTIQCVEPEQEKVGGLHQLWHYHPAIVGGEGCIVNVAAVLVPEMGEAGVFDAVTLRWSGRK